MTRILTYPPWEINPTVQYDVPIGTRSEIVDAQLHCWEPDSERYPWNPAFGTSGGTAALARRHMEEDVVTSAELRAMMRAVGVDATVLVSPGIYGADHSYSFDAASAYPGTFGVVGPVAPGQPGVEDVVRSFRDRPYGLGVRVVILSEADEQRLAGGGYDAIFAAARAGDVPVLVFAPRLLRVVGTVAAAWPDVQLVVDHVGMPQPPLMERDRDPFQTFPELLDLAVHENVAVKWSGAPTLSTEPFPFRDLRPYLHRLLERFGAHRVMWGSDATRVAELYPYAEDVGSMLWESGLSHDDLALVMGGSLRRILRWPRER